MKVPCVTVRDNTERPETVQLGANKLVSTDPVAIIKTVEEMVKVPRDWQHPYGSHVAERIVDICQSKM